MDIDLLLGEAASGDAADGQAVSRAERRDQQTQRVLEAARACFVRHGFQGASMQQICGEAGMSPGALYRYFASKEAIIEAITEQDRREDAELFAAMFSHADVIEGVVSTALAHVRRFQQRQLAPLFAEIRSESMRNPAIESCCRQSMIAVRDEFRRYLQDGIDRGEIAPLVDLDTLMAVLMAIGEGLALNDLLSQGVDPAKLEILIRTTVTAMLRPTAPAARPAA
jgi:AcrR family transcriptional regulator